MTNDNDNDVHHGAQRDSSQAQLFLSRHKSLELGRLNAHKTSRYANLHHNSV